MQTSKGFTLIELLVVIAIIGILAGMVVVNMASAPNAAKDATIKSYMDQMKSTAAIVYNNNIPNSYTGLDTNTEFTQIMTKLNEQTGNHYGWATSTGMAGFCVWARMNSNNNDKSWCIDSAGHSGLYSSTSTCVAANPTCE
ncbi:MAG: type II secretion system protein [Candidatus Paceibacterota bacterium]|jgi:prepilin-type N-terminal cleavage/methylation domain-containing protein